MNYWHLQMFLPYGRGKQKINSIDMLLEPSPVIGTGEWEDVQCYNFKNLDSKGMLAGDIVLVREGATPIALCKIIDDRAFKDSSLEQKHLNIWYRLVEVLEFSEGSKAFPQPQGTLQRLKSPTTDSFKFISTWHKNIMYKKEMESYTGILEYKKQIILQGPPGTGKTKLAREIAYELINNEKVNRPNFITNYDIIRIFKDVGEVSSVAGNVVYKVLNVDKQLQEINQLAFAGMAPGCCHFIHACSVRFFPCSDRYCSAKSSFLPKW